MAIRSFKLNFQNLENAFMIFRKLPKKNQEDIKDFPKNLFSSGIDRARNSTLIKVISSSPPRKTNQAQPDLRQKHEKRKSLKRKHKEGGDENATQQKRSKIDINTKVEQAVSTAVTAIHNAAEKTHKIIKEKVKLAEPAIKVVEESKLAEIVKMECCFPPVATILVATLEKLSDTIVKKVADEIMERVAEAAADEAANKEADTVAKALIAVTTLYSKAKTNNDDEFVAVKCLEGFSKLNKFVEDVYLIKNIFEEALKICFSKPFLVHFQMFTQMVILMESLKDFFFENEEGFLNLYDKDQELPDEIQNCIQPFIAGMGNLRRLSEDVDNQNKEKKEITHAQLDSFRICIGKAFKICKLLLHSEEYKMVETYFEAFV